jgi:O-antigen/teichoic acid export membrane protein
LTARAVKAEDRERLSDLIDAALLLVALPVALALVAGTALSAWLAPVAFGDAASGRLALIAALAGGGGAALLPIPGALLYAHGLVSSYVAASLLSTLLGVVTLVPLIFFFGLEGALLHVALAPLLTLVVVFAVTARRLPPGVAVLGRWPKRIKRHAVSELLQYALYSVVASGTYSLSQVCGRGLVLHRLGDQRNGVLQAAVALGSYLRQLVSGALTADLFPAAAAAPSNEPLRALLDNSQRFFLAVALPGGLVVALLGDLVVRLLYSREFVAASDLLPVYLAGEVLRLLAVLPTTILSARRRFVAAATPIVLGELSFLGALVLLADRALMGYALAWGLSGVMALAAGLLAAAWSLGIVRGGLRTLGCFALPLTLLPSVALLPPSLWLRVALALAIAAAAWRLGLRRDERRALLARLRPKAAP